MRLRDETNPHAPRFVCRLARSEADIRAAQRLRYDVFVRELGADGEMVDRASRREVDRFDDFCDHLVLIDEARPAGAQDHVIGVYRLLPGPRAAAAGGFYSEAEYDLSVLREGGRRLLELGRSCLHRDYRGGVAMLHLWSGLADYVRARGIEVLFGVASFHGTDIETLAEPLSILHHHHLAPPALRVRARPPNAQRMDLLAETAIARSTAMRRVPSLIKAYLRLGGHVGEGAWIDRAFNTTDVCLVLDTATMNARQAELYRRGRA